MFTVEIALGNAEMQTPEHVAEALAAIAQQLEAGRTDGRIRDINGNTVGTFTGDFEEVVDDDE